MIDLAVVLVAGLGTRLLPSTKSQPKEMLPVGRKPVVQYVVEELAAAGLRRLLFVTGPGKASIENHFDINAELIAYLRETGREELLEELEFERRVPEYYYTRQRRPLGLGHAVLCAESLAAESPFVVALGDSIIGVGAQSRIVGRLVQAFDQLKADATIAFEPVRPEEVVSYGMARPRGTAVNPASGEPFELADLIEKPAAGEAPSTLAAAGRYVFSPRIFDALRQTPPDREGEIQLTESIRRMIQEGGRVYGVCLEPGERRFDIGNFGSYFRAFVEFALADPRYGPGLRDYLRSRLGDDQPVLDQ